jgi:hypothetical protein
MKTAARLQRTIYASVLLAGSLLMGGCATTTMREHPDFASHARKIQKIAVIPANVEFTLLVFNGDNERQTDEEKNIASNIADALPQVLSQHGYIVRPFAPDKLGAHGGFTLEQVKTAYQQVSKTLYEQYAVSEKQATNFRVTVGPVIDPIAEALDADAVLYVNYAGYKKSSGLMTKEMVGSVLLGVLTRTVSVPQQSGGSAEVALIDGTTGDVLWTDRAGSLGPGDTGSGLVTRILAKLPNSDAAPVTTQQPTRTEATVVRRTQDTPATEPRTPATDAAAAQ